MQPINNTKKTKLFQRHFYTAELKYMVLVGMPFCKMKSSSKPGTMKLAKSWWYGQKPVLPLLECTKRSNKSRSSR